MRSLNSPWWLAMLLVSTLTVRVAVLLSEPGSLTLDNDAYIRLAINWAQSGIYGFDVPSPRGALDAAQQSSANTHAAAELHVDQGEGVQIRPTAYRPPVYPWLLSWMVERGQLNTLGVAALHLMLGLATAVVVYCIAVRLQIGWPFLPALAVACDPILLRASQLPMTETLITFLAVAVWGVWLRLVDLAEPEDLPRSSGTGSVLRTAALLGVLLAVSVLTRPTMLPWAICIVLLSALIDVRNRQRIAILAMTAVVLLALTAPWALRNAHALGQPVWTTTHGGYTLLLANNPSLYNHFKQSGASRDWDANDFHDRWAKRGQGDPSEPLFWSGPPSSPGDAGPTIDELADDRLAQRAALATIQREPLMFVKSCFIRVGWLWALTPNDGSLLLKWAVGSWYACWFVVAAIGAMKISFGWMSRTWLVPAALLITLTGIHAIYWSNMRMRAPLMPVIYVVAALALTGQSHKTERHAGKG